MFILPQDADLEAEEDLVVEHRHTQENPDIQVHNYNIIHIDRGGDPESNQGCGPGGTSGILDFGL